MTDLDNPQPAAPTIQDELVITLRKPVKLAELEYFEVKLSEPTMGQMRQASKESTSLDQLAQLIALNASVPRPAVDRMLQRDIQEAARFFAQFDSPIR